MYSDVIIIFHPCYSQIAVPFGRIGHLIYYWLFVRQTEIVGILSLQILQGLTIIRNLCLAQFLFLLLQKK